MESDISPSEFLLLKCLYEMKEASLQQLLERLRLQEKENAKSWVNTTVLTLLKRLQNKGYVVRRKEGGRFVYRPQKSLWQTIESIFKRFFGSETDSILISYLFHHKPLTPREQKLLQELQAKIETDEFD